MRERERERERERAYIVRYFITVVINKYLKATFLINRQSQDVERSIAVPLYKGNWICHIIVKDPSKNVIRFRVINLSSTESDNVSPKSNEMMVCTYFIIIFCGFDLSFMYFLGFFCRGWVRTEDALLIISLENSLSHLKN